MVSWLAINYKWRSHK